MIAFKRLPNEEIHKGIKHKMFEQIGCGIWCIVPWRHIEKEVVQELFLCCCDWLLILETIRRRITVMGENGWRTYGLCFQRLIINQVILILEMNG